MLSWALGSSLAAISGIFLVQELGLQVDALTLLIINAFAAAIVGRLRSLPMTYVGGIALGLAISFTQTFLDFRGRFTTAQFAIPSIFLFIVLLALPQARLELRKPPPSSKILQPRTRRSGRPPPEWRVLLVAMAFFTRDMGQVNLNRLTLAMAVGVIMLSLVPLTGWAGQVSLAQITFAGVGAFAMYQFTTGAELPIVHWNIDLGPGNPIGLLFAAVLAVPFGVAMALPALRLQGLYLALASMAFARMAEPLFFDQPEVFSQQPAGRPGGVLRLRVHPAAALPAPGHGNLRHSRGGSGVATAKPLRAPHDRASRQRGRVRHCRHQPSSRRSSRSSPSRPGSQGSAVPCWRCRGRPRPPTTSTCSAQWGSPS